MTYKLFLDDERQAPAGWTLARSAVDAQRLIQNLGWPSEISFDHDLGYTVPPGPPSGPFVEMQTGWFREGVREERTGCDFAKWVAERVADGVALPSGFQYHIHTANPVGGQRIRDVMLTLTGQEPQHFRMQWWEGLYDVD